MNALTPVKHDFWMRCGFKARFSQLHLSNKLNNEVVFTRGAVVIRMRQFQYLGPDQTA